MIIKAQHGQSLMDIAVQYYGSASALVELANDNSLSLSAQVEPGQELIIRDELPDSAVSIFSEYLENSGIVVVSGEKRTAIEILITNDGEGISDNDNNGIGI